MNEIMILSTEAVRQNEAEIMQYVAVGAIVLAALIWAGVKIFSLKKDGSACAGCSLARQCSPKKKQEHARILYTQEELNQKK